MAKARVSTNPMYTGGAGGYSFYVRDGEQVVRQRRNNSNYGESASRSEAQQSRRVRWANLVNMYKALSSWQPKAYEAKRPGQTDYNIFMSLNINESQEALTKDMALQGCCVVSNYAVSRGSLPKIEKSPTDPEEGYIMDIKLSNAISSSTTVGQFAADVLANNPTFQSGDNIAFVIFTNIQQSNGYPYVSTQYKEVTLLTTSTQLLGDAVGSGRFTKTTAGNLKVNVGAASSNEAGYVLIHTRKIAGSLAVSTQSIIITGESFPQQFRTEAWYQECIDSYGVDTSVPLEPGGGGDIAPSAPIDLLAVIQPTELIPSGDGGTSTGNGGKYSANGLAGRLLTMQASMLHSALVGFYDSSVIDENSIPIREFTASTGTQQFMTIPQGTISILVRLGVTSDDETYEPASAVIS